jgi:ribokinase
MRISVVGGYGVGMTMRLTHAPSAGETVGDGILLVGPGGKGSNQAIACARLGAEVSLLTAIGRDSAACEGTELWDAEGVDSFAVVKTARTMTGFIMVDESGENRIAVAPGALAQLEVADLDRFLPTIGSSDVLLVSLEVPMTVAVAALEAARRAGVTTVLNPAPVAALPDAAWALADYLTPNTGEGERLAGIGNKPSRTEIARALSDRTGGTVTMTGGSSRTIVESPSESFTVEALPVEKVRDTTGAGDAFNAALAVAIADGRDLLDAVRFANAAGALAVGVSEVVPSLPRRAAVEALMATHDPRAERA